MKKNLLTITLVLILICISFKSLFNVMEFRNGENTRLAEFDQSTKSVVKLKRGNEGEITNEKYELISEEKMNSVSESHHVNVDKNNQFDLEFGVNEFTNFNFSHLPKDINGFLLFEFEGDTENRYFSLKDQSCDVTFVYKDGSKIKIDESGPFCHERGSIEKDVKIIFKTNLNKMNDYYEKNDMSDVEKIIITQEIRGVCFKRKNRKETYKVKHLFTTEINFKRRGWFSNGVDEKI